MDQHIANVAAKAGVTPGFLTILLQILASLIPALGGICPTPPTPATVKSGSLQNRLVLISAIRQGKREGMLDIPARQIPGLIDAMMAEAPNLSDENANALLTTWVLG